MTWDSRTYPACSEHFRVTVTWHVEASQLNALHHTGRGALDTVVPRSFERHCACIRIRRGAVRCGPVDGLSLWAGFEPVSSWERLRSGLGQVWAGFRTRPGGPEGPVSECVLCLASIRPVRPDPRTALKDPGSRRGGPPTALTGRRTASTASRARGPSPARPGEGSDRRRPLGHACAASICD